jgi:hypothetical protein
MAFEISRFVRTTIAFNAGQITTTFNPDAGDVIENGPAIFSYASATDSIATIGGANYFADVVYDLAVNDIIFCVGSDASLIYQVATVDRDAGTVTVVSFTPAGSVGTSNIQNLAVTTAKIADLAVTNGKIAANAVDSSKLALNTIQYAAVPITAAEFNGMYAAPKLLLAAGGANTQIIVEQMVLAMTFVAAQYAAGGVVAAQYDNTVHGAGVLATATEAAADFTGAAASTSFRQNPSTAVAPFSTSVNKGIYLSNQTAAFTTGDSTFVAHIWYRVIPTV